MTRIFEALRKSQPRLALPFTPPEPGPVRPLAAPAPEQAAPSELLPSPVTVPCLALPEDLARQMTGLRVGLESALQERPCRTVMFLASLSGEGVTTVALQFSALLAVEGRGRPLLVDVNTRRPALAGRLGRGPAMPAPSPAYPGGPPAGAGSPPGSVPLAVVDLSGELLRSGSAGGPGLRGYLAAAAVRFDWVILDGPPVQEAPEAVDLASHADGVVIVVRSGRAKRPVLVRTAELLRNSGVRVLGSVLSRRRLEIPDFIYRRI